MTAKELLSVLQLSGERVRSNSDYLEKLKRELRSEEYATIIERISN